jgi:hypothetical protein
LTHADAATGNQLKLRIANTLTYSPSPKYSHPSAMPRKSFCNTAFAFASASYAVTCTLVSVSDLSLSLPMTLLAILRLALSPVLSLKSEFQHSRASFSIPSQTLALNSLCGLVSFASRNGLRCAKDLLVLRRLLRTMYSFNKCTAAARSPTVSGTSPSIRCCGTTADCLITVSQSVQGALLAPSDVICKGQWA